MPEINGTEVTLCDSLPAALWWDLFPKVANLKSGDKFLDTYSWSDAVALCQATVESWGFDGKPDDSASYERLDLLDMMALVGEVHNHVIGLFNARATNLGEAESGRT